MLDAILYPLRGRFPAFNVFRYITFRTAMAAVTALVISLWLGPWAIRLLKSWQLKQFVRKEGPESHYKKAGTPTMGGLLILGAIFFATLLWMDLRAHDVWIALAMTAALGGIGFLDDWTKVRLKNNRGLSGRAKLLLQFAATLAVSLLIQRWPNVRLSTILTFPFLKNASLDLGVLFIPFVSLVVVGSSNAVNLTDGLDGLAIGAVGIAAATYAVLTYVAGNSIVAHYLRVPFIAAAGQLAVFCGAIVGASLGFLWFNCHPADVFMGDVGSLPLGGAIGIVAVLAKQEILLTIVGGLFVLEAGSVILQVASFKLTGKRIFRMAPLHHHFELAGWAEPRVIIRFWILSLLFATLALSTLKLR
ncbi:MAG: phospho-N-acetylmuramoyl-pentapeptide-transferase [Thermoanaerobaculia bacterium]